MPLRILTPRDARASNSVGRDAPRTHISFDAPTKTPLAHISAAHAKQPLPPVHPGQKRSYRPLGRSVTARPT